MKNKKIVSLFTVTILSFSLLAGCGDESGGDSSDTDYDEEEYSDASAFDGWWVLSPNYYEDVVPILSTFYVDSENDCWEQYDDMGNVVGTYSFYLEDEETISLEMDAFGPIELYLSDDILYYTDDDHEAFVHADEPDFVSVGSYEGTWYKNGDKESGNYYELTEDKASKYEEGSMVLEDNYETNTSSMQYTSGSVDKQTLGLSMEFPNPTLYPNEEGSMFIEKDTFRNNVYVLDGEEITPEAAKVVDMLVNAAYYPIMTEEAESYPRLAFDPGYTFNICTMTDGSQDTSGEETIGSWSIGSDLILHMEYKDGGTEDIDLSGEWDQTLTLNETGQSFYMDFYFEE